MGTIRIKIKGNKDRNSMIRSADTGMVLTTDNDKDLAAKLKLISKRIMDKNKEAYEDLATR